MRAYRLFFSHGGDDTYIVEKFLKPKVESSGAESVQPATTEASNARVMLNFHKRRLFIPLYPHGGKRLAGAIAGGTAPCLGSGSLPTNRFPATRVPPCRKNLRRDEAASSLEEPLKCACRT